MEVTSKMILKKNFKIALKCKLKNCKDIRKRILAVFIGLIFGFFDLKFFRKGVYIKVIPYQLG